MKLQTLLFIITFSTTLLANGSIKIKAQKGFTSFNGEKLKAGILIKEIKKNAENQFKTGMGSYLKLQINDATITLAPNSKLKMNANNELTLIKGILKISAIKNADEIIIQTRELKLKNSEFSAILKVNELFNETELVVLTGLAVSPNKIKESYSANNWYGLGGRFQAKSELSLDKAKLDYFKSLLPKI